MPISLNGNSHLPVPLEDITQPSVKPETFQVAYLHHVINLMSLPIYATKIDTGSCGDVASSLDTPAFQPQVPVEKFTVELTPDSQLRLLTKLPPGF